MGQEGQGIVWSNGAIWNERRKFSLKHLRDMGFGRKSMDSVIIEEADLLIDKLLQAKNGIVEIKNTFNVPIINILWEIVASKKLDPDHPETKRTIGIVNTLIQGFTVLAFLPKIILQIFTVLRLSPTLAKQLDCIEQMREIMQILIVDHLKDIDYDNPRDFMDIFLAQCDINSNFDEEQLIATCNDFFIAGAETTSTTLSWAVLFMTIHPNVQSQCKAEIFEQIGSRPPCIDDVQKLPYVMATIMEVQRMSLVAPGSLPHYLLKRTEIDGYVFEKGTTFIANISKFLMDPKVFHKPRTFNPERFRDENGKLQKNEHFIPFSIGKRICMGESLAKNEMFLFFVRMMQRISFQESYKMPSPNNVIYGLTRIPKPFQVKVVIQNL